jgi:NAD(P)-dependent dehydrogenase (short-subunit alcohol dehydrogenase family)
MARAGANVVVVGRTAEPLERMAMQVRDLGPQALVVVADITAMDDIERVVSETLAAFGYIDCWVNNAGLAELTDLKPLLDIDEGAWDRVVDLNLKWNFFAAQAAARSMTRGGTIVNIASRAATRPTPNAGHYGAAKAGIAALTAAMALEWGHLGIRVNAVSPGDVETEKVPRGRDLTSLPLRRYGQPEDVGAACVFLASDEAAWVTGENINVNGGAEVASSYLRFLTRLDERLKK